MLEGQRALQQLLPSISVAEDRGNTGPACEAGTSSAAPVSRVGLFDFGKGDAGAAFQFAPEALSTEPDGKTFTEERAELMRQDATLHNLVQTLKEAQMHCDQALSLARCTRASLL